MKRKDWLAIIAALLVIYGVSEELSRIDIWLSFAVISVASIVTALIFAGYEYE